MWTPQHALVCPPRFISTPFYTLLSLSLSHSLTCMHIHTPYLVHFLFSSATCSGGKEWQDCGTACPLTCDNYNTTIACTEQCVSGCFCPQGMVDYNGECIAPSECVGMLSTLVCYLYWYIDPFKCPGCPHFNCL